MLHTNTLRPKAKSAVDNYLVWCLGMIKALIIFGFNFASAGYKQQYLVYENFSWDYTVVRNYKESTTAVTIDSNHSSLGTLHWSYKRY